MVKEGDEAPDFDLARDGGGRVKLSGFRGRRVVLYFYPKDDTAGCTRQALDFSTSIAAIRALGAKVIGVSPDSVAKHDKFRDKHSLAVILAADPEKEAILAYGVWTEKKMYGRAYMGVDRSTFLVDEKGRIARVWRGVKVPGHVEEVLAALHAS